MKTRKNTTVNLKKLDKCMTKKCSKYFKLRQKEFKAYTDDLIKTCPFDSYISKNTKNIKSMTKRYGKCVSKHYNKSTYKKLFNSQMECAKAKCANGKDEEQHFNNIIKRGI